MAKKAAKRTSVAGVATRRAAVRPAPALRLGAKRQAAKQVRVKVMRLAHAEGLALPAYQTAVAAGVDLVAAVPEKAPLTLKPKARVLVPTGLVLELPAGFEGQVRPRSGLALKQGVTVLNSPGTIDADYRGEVQVILVNLGDKAVKIARGERVAQLVIAPVVQVALVETQAVSGTERGSGGFGSTGTAVRAVGAKKAKPKPSSGVPAKR